MKVTKHLIQYIQREMKSCAIDTKARLSRATGISEPTIGRILAGKRDTISDTVAEKLCTTFGIKMEQLLMITLNHRTEEPAQQVFKDEPAATHCPQTNPEIRRLCKWLEDEATPDQVEAVKATARAVGFQDTAKHITLWTGGIPIQRKGCLTLLRA